MVLLVGLTFRASHQGDTVREQFGSHDAFCHGGIGFHEAPSFFLGAGLKDDDAFGISVESPPGEDDCAFLSEFLQPEEVTLNDPGILFGPGALVEKSRYKPKEVYELKFLGHMLADSPLGL